MEKNKREAEKMENSLKRKLAQGEKVLGTFIGTGSVCVTECLGRTGLDFVVIDNEHSPIEAETSSELVRAAELTGLCPLARVREISRPAVLKLLDVGVQGLIVPNVQRVEDVAQLIRYAKYAPLGERGFCPTRKDGFGFDEPTSVPALMEKLNGETLLIPQCETVGALEEIEKIAAMPGVDGIFVGPFDLSIAMGLPGQFDHSDFQAALERILKACRAAGKFCLCFGGTPEAVVDGFRRGFDGMAYGIDTMLLIRAVKNDVEQLRRSI